MALCTRVPQDCPRTLNTHPGQADPIPYSHHTGGRQKFEGCVLGGEGPIASLAWLVLDDLVMGVEIPAPETEQPRAKENSHQKEQNWAVCRDTDGPRECRTD